MHRLFLSLLIVGIAFTGWAQISIDRSPTPTPTPTPTRNCLVAPGNVRYPWEEWGREQASAVSISVQLDSRAVPSFPPLGQRTLPSTSTSFKDAASEAVLNSSFDRSCAGITTAIFFRFELRPEQADTPQTQTIIDGPNRVRVTAKRPPEACTHAAQTDEEATWMRTHAEFLVDNRRHPESLACSDASLAWKPNADALLLRGMALRKLNQLEAAIEAYDQGLRTNPDQPYAFLNRANAWRDLGRYESAIKDYTTAVHLMEDFGVALVNRGGIYLRTREYSLALKDFQRAAEIDDTDEKAQNNMGLALQEMGDLRGAIAAYDRSIALDKSNESAWSNRSNAWTLLGELDRALNDATEALRLNPRMYEAHIARGLALALLKRSKEAEQEFTVAVQLLPSSGGAYASRALARRDLGNLEGAAEDEAAAIRFGFKPGLEWFTIDPVTGQSVPWASRQKAEKP